MKVKIGELRTMIQKVLKENVVGYETSRLWAKLDEIEYVIDEDTAAGHLKPEKSRDLRNAFQEFEKAVKRNLVKFSRFHDDA